ncbi:MAG TPA: nucleoside-diphosphate kinase, partial [Planctomycetaceae bacterium]|nr:nucleoside-diphosphate kinase [Planctomycetaceae bacterium]
TLILFKPDAVQRQLCGELLSRLERKGLKIVGLKMLQITGELARQHYAEHVDKPFYPSLEKFITSGPVVALVAEGPEAIRIVRDPMGPTDARQAPAGTIRGDFGLSRQMNLVHGSDSPESARREIELFFRPEELLDYSLTLDSWLTPAEG